MNYKFNRELYSKIALIKAAYNFTDRAFIHLDSDADYFYVYLDMKAGTDPISEKEFTNEMLAQSVRHEIYLQTKNIRELLLARSMATTVVTDAQVSSGDDLFEDEYHEQDILKDWFVENDKTKIE